MDDGLDGIIAQTLAGNTPGSGSATQAPPAPSESVGQPGNTAPRSPQLLPNAPQPGTSGGGPGTAPAAPDTQGNFRWENVPPEQLDAYRYWQGEYTRARQKDAEERRQQAPAEGARRLSPEAEQQALLIEELARENPQMAAQYLTQMAERFAGGQGVGVPSYESPYGAPVYGAPPSAYEPPAPFSPDPYAPDPYSPEDPRDARIAALERREQEREFRHGLSRVEATLGRALTPQELAKTAAIAQRKPGVDAEEAFFLAHRREFAERLRQMGRDEALQLRQSQQGLPPAPSAHVAPQGAVHEPNWSDPDAVIRYSIDQVLKGQG